MNFFLSSYKIVDESIYKKKKADVRNHVSNCTHMHYGNYR